VSSTAINFGSVAIASKGMANLVLTNAWTANLTLSTIAATGANFAIGGFSSSQTISAGQSGQGTVTLSPNQSLTFDVNFSPSSTGTESGTVTITSNASGSPATITLSGIVPPASHAVALAWTASSSTVSGYKVYRSTTNGSNDTKINASLIATWNYVDSSVQNGTTYYYVTTAVDSGGAESSYTNQASAANP
jgi:hypothetical protein